MFHPVIAVAGPQPKIPEGGVVGVVPPIRYVKAAAAETLVLHLFDGTYRSVVFEDIGAAKAALMEGRAEADCIAVENGLLPLGSVYVSRSAPLDADDVMNALSPEDDNRLTDSIATIRLRFSQSRRAERMHEISSASDGVVRQERPDKAALYAALLETINRVLRNRSLH